MMEGVVAKGWAFVQDDLRHVSDVMYERFQKDGYSSVGTYPERMMLLWLTSGGGVDGPATSDPGVRAAPCPDLGRDS